MKKCFGNLPLELHSADFGIFGTSQTPSLVSAPKIPKNYESQTENPSVVDSLHESTMNQVRIFNISSLREFAKRSGANSWQSSLFIIARFRAKAWNRGNP